MTALSPAIRAPHAALCTVPDGRVAARCTISFAPLDVPGRPWSRNCGGHCIACMAEAGDPECAEAVAAMAAGEAFKDDLAKLSDPAAVYVNMLRGTIAKPNIESIVSLYGAGALADALPPEKGEEG